MFNSYEICPAYNQIYLKNIVIHPDNMINVNSVDYNAGYAASTHEIVVFTKDVDIPLLSEQPVTVFVASVYDGHPADEGMIKIFAGNLTCETNELVICNPLTVASEDRVIVDVTEYAGSVVSVEVYVDRVINAECIFFLINPN